MKKLLLLPALLLAWGLSTPVLAQISAPAARASTALSRLIQPARPSVRTTASTRPGHAVHYLWDEAAAAWTEPTLIAYAYNGQGNPTEETAADSATGTNQARTQYSYDGQGRNTQELNQLWLNGVWQNQSRYSATYDAAGNTTEELQQNWRNGAWITAFGSRYANTYAGGVLSSRTETRWDNGSYINWSRELYTVVNGQWTTLTGQDWDGSIWEDYQRITDIVWQDWPGRRLATATKQQWTGIWEDLSYVSAAYQPNGSNVFTVQVPTAGNGRVNESRYSELYDAYGNELAYREESWQSNAWEVTDETRSLLTYNPANSVVRKTTQYYDASIPGFVNNERYNYSGFVTITRTTPRAAAAVLQLFPNPAATRVTLQLPGSAAPLTGDVLNALGQSVLHFSLPPQATQLDVAPLPAGLYTVRLQTPQGPILARLVRQ